MENIVLSIAYYTSNEYEKFKSAADDPEIWNEEYSVWLVRAESVFNEYQQKSTHIERIYLNLEEFQIWAAIKQFKNDSNSRSLYAAELLKQKQGGNPN